MITGRPFGVTKKGAAVTCWTITSENGSSVSILDYGAAVRSILVPDRDGKMTDVVLGYETVEAYEEQSYYVGATIGRHGNRIKDGKFALNGVTYQLACNNGPNHNHGGLEGFDKKMFTAESDGNVLRMKLVSPDGDQGYPGTLRLTVEFSLQDSCLKIHYLAESDRDTLCNLTNHCYYDLSDGRNPLGQYLQVNADYITENDENTLPTGKFLTVEHTPFDFRTEKQLGKDLYDPLPQLARLRGYDHTFVLRQQKQNDYAAILRSPETGISLKIRTDLPGLQVYSASYMEKHCGKYGRTYGPWCAVALETQCFPNGMEIEAFPKPILRQGEVYDHTTTYAFSAE